MDAEIYLGCLPFFHFMEGWEGSMSGRDLNPISNPRDGDPLKNKK